MQTGELEKWVINLKKMTYIIGGKINNRAFILVDKVINDDPEQSTNKLYNSITDKNIYISLTGDGNIMEFVKMYDKKLKYSNQKLKINDDFINHITTKLENNVSRGQKISKRTSLYVIDNNEFLRVDCNFKSNKFIDYKKKTFNNDEFITCSALEKKPLNIEVHNIENFCKFYIKKLFETICSEYSYDEYFKNGFDYIEQ